MSVILKTKMYSLVCTVSKRKLHFKRTYLTSYFYTNQCNRDRETKVCLQKMGSHPIILRNFYI